MEEEVFGKILTNIYGFIIERFPENRSEFASMGSSLINSSMPSGSLKVLFQNFSIIDNKDDNSSIFGYDGRGVLDYMSGFLSMGFERIPEENIIKVFIESSINKRKL